MARRTGGDEGKYAHVFAYRAPKQRHIRMRDVLTNLGKIYKRHGSLGIRLYVWGETGIFQGFAGLHRLLGVTPDEELWLEVVSYEDASKLKEVVKRAGADSEAKALWDELQRMVGAGRSIAMGEFEMLAAEMRLKSSSSSRGARGNEP